MNSLQPEKPEMINTWAHIILLSFLLLLVFYPAITAEYSLIDDSDAVAAILSDSGLSLKSIFFPSVRDGGYYRPLLGLSQYLDKLLWGMEPLITHTENILLHLWNVIWLYLLVAKTLSSENKSKNIPVLAALLFAVHPVVTESVCWYSGRTDLLATAFTLPALYLIIFWIKNKNHGFLPLLSALVLLLAGLLAKESTLAVLMALPFIYSLASQADNEPHANHIFPRWYWYLIGISLSASLMIALLFFKFIPAAILIIICLFVGWYLKRDLTNAKAERSGLFKKAATVFTLSISVPALFWGIRSFVFTTSVSRISQTVKLMTQDIDYTVGLFIGAVGFYLKKFFLPLPLNFTIREIDPAYQLLGICFLFCIMLLLLYRSAWSDFFLIGLLLISPALPFVFGTIAWTSYAERYAYLSTAFWAAALALWSYQFHFSKVLLYSIGAVIVLFASISFQRAQIWQANLTLLADTVQKSPKFRDIRAFYVLALYRNGDLKNAEQQYKTAMSIPSTTYNPLLDTLYARILHQQGRSDEAFAVLDAVDIKTKDKVKEVAELRRAFMEVSK